MISALRRAAMLGAVAAAFLTATPSDAPAQTAVVRGRLQHIVNPQGQWVPVPGLAVTLRAVNGVVSTPAFTGHDGMYYLYNVPPGPYTLDVWNQGAPAPFLSIPIGVSYIATPNGPLFDIPPINIP